MATFSLFFLILFSSPVHADTPEQQLTRCLHQAEDSPDIGMANAERWLKKDGGDRAELCRAFAQFHRGEYLLSAGAFAELASKRDEKDRKHAASLHAQAGLAYMRGNDNKMAEAEYGTALKLEPQDPDIWIDRATERASNENYWDAIDDLNHALTVEPDMAEAFRLRAKAWAKLGHDSNARADFERAAMLDDADKTPAMPK